MQPEKVSVNNDPILPGSPMMTQKSSSKHFTHHTNSKLHKTVQKDIEANHHILSTKKPRQLSGRHH